MPTIRQTVINTVNQGLNKELPTCLRMESINLSAWLSRNELQQEAGFSGQVFGETQSMQKSSKEGLACCVGMTALRKSACSVWFLKESAWDPSWRLRVYRIGDPLCIYR